MTTTAASRGESSLRWEDGIRRDVRLGVVVIVVGIVDMIVVSSLTSLASTWLKDGLAKEGSALGAALLSRAAAHAYHAQVIPSIDAAARLNQDSEFEVSRLKNKCYAKLNTRIISVILVRVELGNEQQLKISKAECASGFEKNSPPEVLRVIVGANHH